jgi:pimeloyl-CoA synthetase
MSLEELIREEVKTIIKEYNTGKVEFINVDIQNIAEHITQRLIIGLKVGARQFYHSIMKEKLKEMEKVIDRA